LCSFTHFLVVSAGPPLAADYFQVPRTTSRPVLRYVAPIVVFGALTAVEGWLPQSIYPAFYFAKIFIVTVTLLVARRSLRDIQPSWRVVFPALLLGLVVFVQWVAIDNWLAYPHLGSRVGFNPFAELHGRFWRFAFLAVRFYGLVLVVPVMEELFLRSFVLRSAMNADFESVPIGEMSLSAFAVVTGLSAIAHPEWLVAIIANVAYTLLLYRTRSLFATVVAHATTNCALGVYILATGDWRYW
jgi:CAAX prenyl protease-like protein